MLTKLQVTEQSVESGRNMVKSMEALDRRCFVQKAAEDLRKKD